MIGDGSPPLVLLREHDAPHRIVPLAVGGNEAMAIAFGLQGVEVPRPLTHDLLVSTVAALGSRVSRVVVTHVTEGTFHARLYLETAAGDETEVDSRTSDAIGVAVRTGSPIYVDERVLDEAGVEPDGTEETSVEEEERLAVFREFVNSLDVDLPNQGGETGPPANEES